MEVRPGYKRTEIGIIPENWDLAQIGEIASVKTGPFGSSLHEADYVRDGTPIITVEHLSQLGVAHSNLPMVSDSDRDRLDAYSLEENDIVFSRVGSVDRNALVRAEEGGWLFSGRLLRIRPERERAFAPYLSYHFHSEPFKQRVKRMAVGQTMASLNTQIMKGLTVVLPPLDDQRAIAAVLSDVDALITALDRLIAKKRAIKRGAMQQLLTGRTRLPGFSGVWEAKKVSQLGEVVTGGTPSTKAREFWGEDVPWVTPTDITSRRDIAQTQRQLTVLGLSRIRRLPANSVLVTCIASIGKNAILRRHGACNQQINAVVPSDENDAQFLYYMFESGSDYLKSKAGMTATSIISKRVFSELPFVVPPLLEQRAIAAVLSDMDAEIAALEARRDKTLALKKGMMHELLTGRTRLI